MSRIKYRVARWVVITILAMGHSASLSAQISTKLLPAAFESKMSEVKEYTLIDVRTGNEYAQGHIPGAKNIDFYRNDFKSQLGRLDKNKPVFVYCAVGGRSGSTASTLTALGFKEVYDLNGGFQSWAQNKQPVEK